MTRESNMETRPLRRSWYVPDEHSRSTEPIHWRLDPHSHAWQPPTDVFETDTEIVVRVEIAGVREEDFSVSLDDQYLFIRGTRQDSNEHRAYHQMEIPFGEFSTEVELPGPVQSDKIEAVYQDGFLRVTLPKARPQQIQITTD